MADIEDIKRELRVGALLARKTASERVLTEAAEELVKKASITESDLISVGRKIASDPQIFSASDIEDINNILDQIRRDKK